MRTRQLPDYIMYAHLHWVHAFVKGIKEQTGKVYSLLYRNDDSGNNFMMADTVGGVLNGKVGSIISER